MSPVDAVVLSPEMAIFYCEAFGVLAPNITWRMDGETLESDLENITILIGSTGDTIMNSTLQLLNTLPIDTGTYTCVATNAAGSDTASAELTVNCMSGAFSMCLFKAYVHTALCTLSYFRCPNNNYSTSSRSE